MVAKFLEKCSISTVALDELKQEIIKLNESKHEPVQMTNSNTMQTKDSDLYYENIDYCEENIEYVMYDSTTDIIEEAEIFDRSHETQETDAIDSDGDGNNQRTYNTTTDEVCLQTVWQTSQFSHLTHIHCRSHYPEPIRKNLRSHRTR